MEHHLRFDDMKRHQKLLMVKEYENNALLEEYARLPGPNIDGIIGIPNLNLDFILVEVSGTPCSASENYNHYKGDMNKIGKNLKYMFKIIITKKVEASIKIPVEPILFASTMPKFVSQMFDLGEKIEHFAKEVENFLAITDSF
ncbi:hypothetical protein MFLAVUS_003241 [Mucor flavus]|uniref:Uncharacterized protein n=1 Tax=Mucor flavus TaxID=439312 RepID=A0ABP9YSJ9_9FUNG